MRQDNLHRMQTVLHFLKLSPNFAKFYGDLAKTLNAHT